MGCMRIFCQRSFFSVAKEHVKVKWWSPDIEGAETDWKSQLEKISVKAKPFHAAGLYKTSSQTSLTFFSKTKVLKFRQSRYRYLWAFDTWTTRQPPSDRAEPEACHCCTLTRRQHCTKVELMTQCIHLRLLLSCSCGFERYQKFAHRKRKKLQVIPYTVKMCVMITCKPGVISVVVGQTRNGR